MDKENKYYSVIKNLIENHKKYNDNYLAIIEDIIDDVYLHAQSVISAVNSEPVIFSYLEKIVATSIITVPRKLNFHTEIKHRVVRTEIKENMQSESVTEPAAATMTAVLEKEPESPIDKIQVNKEYVDKMINSADPVNTDSGQYNHDEEIDIAEETSAEAAISENQIEEPVVSDDEIIYNAEDDDDDLYTDAIEFDFDSDSDENFVSDSEEISDDEDAGECAEIQFGTEESPEVFESSYDTQAETDSEQEESMENVVLKDAEEHGLTNQEISAAELMTEEDSESLAEKVVLKNADEIQNNLEYTEEDEQTTVERIDLTEAPETEQNESEGESLSPDILTLEDVSEDENNEEEITESLADENSEDIEYAELPEEQVLEEDSAAWSDSDETTSDDLSETVIEGASDEQELFKDELSYDNLESNSDELQNYFEDDLQQESSEELSYSTFSDNDDGFDFNADSISLKSGFDNDSEELAELSEESGLQTEDFSLSNTNFDDISFVNTANENTNSFDEVNSADSFESLNQDDTLDFLEESAQLDSSVNNEEDSVNTSDSQEVKTPDYSAFAFNPSDVQNTKSVANITENINKLNESFPELHISEVYNLRYKQKKKIDDISDELGMSKEDVIKALNKMISIIY